MKILVVNPNISPSVTELIHAEAVRSASSGTEITTLTAQFGVAYIETRFEAMIGAYATAEQVAANLPGHDAVVVAAFGDPGLTALREVLPRFLQPANWEENFLLFQYHLVCVVGIWTPSTLIT